MRPRAIEYFCAFAAVTWLNAGCAHFIGMHDFASKSTPEAQRVTVESAPGVVVDEVDGRSWLGSGTGTFVLDPGPHEFLVRFHLFEGGVVKYRFERTAVRFTFAAGKRYRLVAKVDPQVTHLIGYETVEEGATEPGAGDSPARRSPNAGLEPASAGGGAVRSVILVVLVPAARARAPSV